MAQVAQLLEAEAMLTPEHMEMLNMIALEKGAGTSMRFVAPPFMYKSGATYSWGERPPTKR